MSEISRDDWLKALTDLDAASIEPSDAVSVVEFAELVGIKRTAAKERLARLVTADKAERTTKRVRCGDGRVIRVPAYRLK